ncbi:DUF72 domain-containing protein [Cytophagales bacterium LB-30]|uniref:DUF72 domain-containing protein n=1 Tax=Shiella aurantiaca TaxID=3058365 RepID=A0ABT8F1X2_9BACT|nr:DUF72 domain-containing protein [Shiella aurantiaca]MDN4164246.1 DUF72 domain-containing protein [Shiella aurantiaca]
MIFGKVDDPGKVDFTLPPDHPQTKEILKRYKSSGKSFEVYVGCAKWNKKDLKGFYPKGVKDELAYYATQFNSIEMNSTFYNMPNAAQVEVWASKTPESFRFFPKITNSISHFSRLKEVGQATQVYCDAISHFGERLGAVFLQLHDKFSPKEWPKLEQFLREFPAVIPLAVEVRHEDWFKSGEASEALTHLLEELGQANILVDTAGRRDMLHMRLTNEVAFIRYVGANHPKDYERLDEWVERIKTWKEQGLQKLYFFVHQNVEVESPLLSAHFIKHLNKALTLDVSVPQLVDNKGLFD